METQTQTVAAKPAVGISRRDLLFGLLAGLLMGALFLPVLSAMNTKVYSMISFAVIPFFVIATPIGLMVADVIAKRIAVIWQLAKFVVTGGLNALMDLGVLSLLQFFSLEYLGTDPEKVILSAGITITFYSLYKGISFIIANINSYIWNKYWTFNQSDGKKTEFVQFFIVSIVGFLINVLVASFVFTSINPILGLDSKQWGLIGAATGAVVGLVWNFLGYKFIVFKK